MIILNISLWYPVYPPKNVSPVGTGRKVSNFIVLLEKVSQVHSVCHPRTKATKNREVGRCVQLRDDYGITDIGQ